MALRDLLAALDLAVFERLPGGLFEPVGRLPGWFSVTAGFPADLAEHFPMLGFFMPEFERAWEEGAPAVTSDMWTENGANGEERQLEAVASSVHGRRFLVLKVLPPALRAFRQHGVNIALIEEEVRRLKIVAERATQAKSDFLATMSHEIRTPLNAVIGMADVLAATPLTPEQQKYVEISQRNGVGLLTLINDILDLSKIESGKVELESAAMDLRDVIDRALEVVEGRATAKGLTLRKTIAPEVPVYLIGDANRLRQVIVNLLGNAVKFTENGRLEVAVTPDPEGSAPGDLRFAVSDTGAGIPEEKLSAVFESFTQADSSTTRKYGGTGLGLTISKQFVELMGGRIWVESTVGVGSTFWFTARFGVQEDQSDRLINGHPRGETQVSPAAREPLASGLRILLADDSEDNRFLIVAYLKNTGSSVDIAENGETAALLFRSALAGSQPYDLVLMDVEMPVMDGYSATREIRRFENESGAPPTPVLALTAHAFAETAARGLEAGFTEVLTKPIRRVTLLEALVRHAPAGRPALFREPVAHEKVRVEEGMEDVVPGYLDKRRAEVSAYRQALADHNFAAIRALSHKMKGTGGGYGFPALTELGAQIERAAKREDARDVRARVDELAQYLQSVELEYSK
jgi:signal transduction histidine kinase/DNA-binding response OmpR family regulator